MDSSEKKSYSRRELLRGAAVLASSAFLPSLLPNAIARMAAIGYGQQTGTAPADPLAAIRAMFGAIPIQSQKLSDRLTLLSGPGGNVVVLSGHDGKIVVDTFVAPAWPKLKEALNALGSEPVKTVVNTHWHYDHTDNNAPFHKAGATVLAHENSKARMSQPHELAVLGLQISPSPAEALPQQTFKDTVKLAANGENLYLAHVPPAHTDTDLYVHFEKADVLHAGDCFFNGLYPYIDSGTGGKIGGMVAATEKLLAVAGRNTKIIPGHGPLGNKSDVEKFRDMLVIARDRVQKLKSSGKSMDEAVAAKPFSDLDPVWGKGHFNGDSFVQIVYLAL
ncbi:MAG TPA: MBL fold metallo-hydrolase [Candidatus Sulfotelmatobacter sp.]|nr:MBL fold metallo-hydrolase [Candidatus Sulfotelmatobacter sp.]